MPSICAAAIRKSCLDQPSRFALRYRSVNSSIISSPSPIMNRSTKSASGSGLYAHGSAAGNNMPEVSAFLCKHRDTAEIQHI